MQALGVLERSPVLGPLEVPGDTCRAFLLLRVELQGQVDRFLLGLRPGQSHGALKRVIVNVDLEEQSTGELSVSGGFSTADGFLAELSIAERNLLGRGLYGKAGVQYGQKNRGFDLSFADPYFLGYRMLMGLDFYSRQTFSTNFVSYDSLLYGGGIRFGFALREDCGNQPGVLGGDTLADKRFRNGSPSLDVSRTNHRR